VSQEVGRLHLHRMGTWQALPASSVHPAHAATAHGDKRECGQKMPRPRNAHGAGADTTSLRTPPSSVSAPLIIYVG